jgi:hypothetical protein
VSRVNGQGAFASIPYRTRSAFASSARPSASSASAERRAERSFEDYPASPGGVIGKIAQRKQAAPGQKNFHRTQSK